MNMNRNIIGLIQISLMLMVVLVPSAVAADDGPPQLPMVFSGIVLNEDTNEWAPAGTLITAKDSETGNDVGTATVGSSGTFGDQANNKLIVNDCTAFDLYLTVGGNEINVGSTDWDSGDVLTIHITYSEPDTSSGSSSSSSNYYKITSRDSAEAGGAGVDTTLSTLPETSTSPEEDVSQTAPVSEGTSLPFASILVIIIIIAIAAFVMYNRHSK